MSEFKLIRELGLPLYPGSTGVDGDPFNVRASDLEALLEKGARVYQWPDSVTGDLHYSHKPNGFETATALLIDFQPIVKDTAESLLRHLLDQCFIIGDVNKARAKKLLASRQESGGEK